MLLGAAKLSGLSAPIEVLPHFLERESAWADRFAADECVCVCESVRVVLDVHPQAVGGFNQSYCSGGGAKI